ncbi:MAG: hypothetical protein HYY24_11000 [Verrucomicrobia bacterium]|nr:hypothetical protein [Verrucomicrobiota bacterium]
MNAVTLKAHYDGKHICLDEPFELQPDTKLIVMVLPESAAEWEEEREAWYELGRRSRARAYGDDEPDYSDCVEKCPVI